MKTPKRCFLSVSPQGFTRGMLIAATLFFFAPISLQAAHNSSPEESRIEEQLGALRHDMDKAQTIWEEAIDDPVSDEELKRSYHALQDICRDLYKRKGGFATAKQKQLCEITQYPYEMYFNEMLIKVNNLRKQLFEIDTPGTVANDYYRRPSKNNLDKLRNIFEQVNRYYVGAPYTWNRYYNKYLFSRSRLNHKKKIWEDRLAEFRAAQQQAKDEHYRQLARKRAEFAFRQLKEEAEKNNLPFCGRVDVFYLAGSLEDYLAREKEWVALEMARKQSGKAKEVVIFIHGMGEDRGAWKKFPLLLSQEDVANPQLDRYFQAYVFRYDTVEDSKSVEGFRRELAGFIKDILKSEEVSRVNLVGHSLGGVLSLKYLVQYLDDEQTGADPLPKDTGARAQKLIQGHLDGRYRKPIARFVGIAPSLSGSEVANFMAGLFKRDPPLYERSLAPFQSGIPVAGDLQVLENQIGSRVNITSFTRLDFERPLDPYGLLDFLPDSWRSEIGPEQMEKLHAMGVKAMTVIGKQPFVIPLVAEPEEDGLVKCYSANLNHIYMADPDARNDIGYKQAQVRYVKIGHNQMVEVGDRNHPSYRYVVSFLSDNLIPQEDRDAMNVRHFICLLRVYPANLDPDENPDFCFFPEERVYFTGDERYELPPLSVRVMGGKEGSANARIDKSSWNPFTGVHFLEGHQENPEEPAWITLELSAEGFQSKVVNVPVSGGLVTYCVRLKLEPEPAR